MQTQTQRFGRRGLQPGACPRLLQELQVSAIRFTAYPRSAQPRDFGSIQRLGQLLLSKRGRQRSRDAVGDQDSLVEEGQGRVEGGVGDLVVGVQSGAQVPGSADRRNVRCRAVPGGMAQSQPARGSAQLERRPLNRWRRACLVSSRARASHARHFFTARSKLKVPGAAEQALRERSARRTSCLQARQWTQTARPGPEVRVLPGPAGLCAPGMGCACSCSTTRLHMASRAAELRLPQIAYSTGPPLEQGGGEATPCTLRRCRMRKGMWAVVKRRAPTILNTRNGQNGQRHHRTAVPS
jgi:hypothetical protein